MRAAKYIALLIVFLLPSLPYTNSAANYGTYYSLKEALAEPLQVKTLILKGKRINNQSLAQLNVFKNLESLLINDAPLSALPASISENINLRKISVHNTNLNSFPDALCQLENLIVINFASNKIESLPECIGSLKNLLTFVLNNNRLKELPEGLSNLQSMLILDVSENQISKLPDSFNNLIDMHTLNLSSNNLKKLPDMSRLWLLKKIDLRKNQIPIQKVRELQEHFSQAEILF